MRNEYPRKARAKPGGKSVPRRVENERGHCGCSGVVEGSVVEGTERKGRHSMRARLAIVRTSAFVLNEVQPWQGLEQDRDVI